MSSPISFRLPPGTIDRLTGRAGGLRIAPRTLAQRYVEEGLRMDEHPLVRFADGPAGRRARLLGTGLDVWEVVAIVRDNDGDVRAAADYAELPTGLVQAAVIYASSFPDEIDGWIALNDRDAERAHADWQRSGASVSE